MDNIEVLRRVEHTLLAPSTSLNEIYSVCDDAIEFGAVGVCIPPCYVRNVVKYVNGRIKTCTVIGFPNGYNTMEVKIAEVANAVNCGCDEVDMVANIGLIKSGRFCDVGKEIEMIKKVCSKNVLKVIIECCLLTDNEKEKMCEIVASSGADYIKTSTGFSKGGATIEDVRLLRRCSQASLKIKAAGGIRDFETAKLMIEAGADRLGASALVNLLKKEKNNA